MVYCAQVYDARVCEGRRAASQCVTDAGGSRYTIGPLDRKRSVMRSKIIITNMATTHSVKMLLKTSGASPEQDG